jgi:hypothetical protein
MPIIKDKYKAKRTRTTPIVQRNPKAQDIDRSADGSSVNLNTSQLQAISTQESRNNKNIIGTRVPDTNSVAAKISNGKVLGYRLTTVDSIENLFVLNPDENLNNIIINYLHSTSSTSNISLYWSLSPPSDLENTVEGGRVTSLDSKLYRIISSTFNSATSLSLYESCQGFENINKKIYFYGVAHTVDSNGVMFTFLVG